MNRPPEIRASLIRSPEEYTVEHIAQYANELLRKFGSTKDGDFRLPWRSHLGDFTLLCKSMDEEYPQYQLDVQDDSKINMRDVYIFLPTYAHVSHRDENDNVIATDTPTEDDLAVMAYLRSNPYLKEPLGNRKTSRMYRATMAHLAIDNIHQAGLISIAELATERQTSIYLSKLAYAQQEAFDTGIDIDGCTYFFTPKQADIAQALSEQILTHRHNQRALPPASHGDDPMQI